MALDTAEQKRSAGGIAREDQIELLATSFAFSGWGDSGSSATLPATNAALELGGTTIVSAPSAMTGSSGVAPLVHMTVAKNETRLVPSLSRGTMNC